MDHSWSRRRLLSAGAVGFAASVAGCGRRRRSDKSNYDPPENDDSPDESSEVPDDFAAYFKATDGDEFSFPKMEKFQSRVLHELDLVLYHHDERAFDVTVNENTVTVDFEAKLLRDIVLTLHVRNEAGEFTEIEQTLRKPTDESIKFREYTREFDVSNITFPRNAGGLVVLTGHDTYNGGRYGSPRILSRHQFVAIEHANGTRWVNDPRVNRVNYYDDGPIHHIGGKGRGYVATEDHGDTRTVFLAVRTNANGEVFGVSTHVDKNFVQKYKRKNNRWKERHNHVWEGHFATQVSHLTELAEKTHQAITDIGLSEDYNRIDALGDLIQMIPYGTPVRQGNPPIIVLHDTMGDCDETSVLMAGILANEPWNIRTGYVESEIQGVEHVTLGIDKRDFDASGHSIFWVRPTDKDLQNGLPDTRYAFLEMTSDWDLGERSGGVQNISSVRDTGTFDHRYSYYHPHSTPQPDF
jgi:hypothetical protein